LDALELIYEVVVDAVVIIVPKSTICIS